MATGITFFNEIFPDECKLQSISDSKPQAKLVLTSSIVLPIGKYNTATKSQVVPFVDALLWII